MRKIIPITVLAGTAAAVGIIRFAADESTTSSLAPSAENTTVSGTVAPKSSAAPSASSRPAPTISSNPQEEAPARTKLTQRPEASTQAAPALTAMPAAPAAAQAPAASSSPVLPNPAAETAVAGYEISGQTGTDRPVAAQPTHRPTTSGFGPAIAPPAVAAQAPASTVAPAPIASAAVTPTEANASKATAANRKSTPTKLGDKPSSPTRIDLTSPAPATAAPAVVPNATTATAATIKKANATTQTPSATSAPMAATAAPASAPQLTSPSAAPATASPSATASASRPSVASPATRPTRRPSRPEALASTSPTTTPTTPTAVAANSSAPAPTTFPQTSAPVTSSPETTAAATAFAPTTGSGSAIRAADNGGISASSIDVPTTNMEVEPTAAYSKPVGYVTLGNADNDPMTPDVLARSEVTISVPLLNSVDASATVASASGSVITLVTSPPPASPPLVSGAFAPPENGAPYMVEITTGNSAGLFLCVSSNTESTITVMLGEGYSLADLAEGDSLSLRKAWTIETFLPSADLPDGAVLAAFDVQPGVDNSPTPLYLNSSAFGGWINGASFLPAGNAVLYPGESFILKNNTDTAIQSLVITGEVPTSPSRVRIANDTMGVFQETRIAYVGPVEETLNQAGFNPSEGDQFLAFDQTSPGLDKSPSQLLIFNTSLGGWIDGSNFMPIGDIFKLKGGQGYVYRRSDQAPQGDQIISDVQSYITNL